MESEMKQFPYQRQVTRIPLTRLVEVHSSGAVVTVTESRDLSLRGFYMFTDERLPLGAPCEAKLYLGTTEEPLVLTIKGSIARHDKTGMGVEFAEMDLDTYHHLRNLVLYNAADPNQIQQEFSRHLGLHHRTDD